ncbi:MAG TPA: alkaline phosphatase family protein [Acidimicrobiales bacterium]|nr:alkaline phosphatase family protein [Acidimicrobiales bacterium]
MRTRLAAAGLLTVSLVAPISAAGATAASLPAIHHVWQIELENESESSSFAAPGTYLNQLTSEGVFLPNYYGTGHVSADNYIATISGQLGNPATDSDCQLYTDFVGTVTSTGYPLGTGCVYPASVKTLPDQLTAAGLTWNGWMEDMGNDPTREAPTCGQPPSTVDDTQSATATDQYAARHNPFVYFHSLVDGSPSPCQQHVLPLSSFQASLSAPANFNSITPNLCDDGHDSPCANGQPGGLTSANAFLQQWVPAIEASPAYQQDGLIVITFDETPPTDTSGCCGEVSGGGKVGAVLLSPLLTPHTSSCAYNHFSLLRTYEDLFGTGTHLGQASVAGPIDPDLTAVSDPCA